jgi:hypothetical protein
MPKSTTPGSYETEEGTVEFMNRKGLGICLDTPTGAVRTLAEEVRWHRGRPKKNRKRQDRRRGTYRLAANVLRDRAGELYAIGEDAEAESMRNAALVVEETLRKAMGWGS